MGMNLSIDYTKMPLTDVVEFCKRWNNYHEEYGEWNEDEMYVDYDVEYDNNFTRFVDWRASHIYPVYNWFAEHIEHHSENGGLFIITREQINELSLLIDKLIEDLAEKLGENHDINDYLIDKHYWNHNMPNFSDAYTHYGLLYAQKDMKKLAELLNAEDDITLVYYGA